MTTHIISDQEMEKAFEGTNFGENCNHWALLNASVFKKLVGDHCGHTIEQVMKELGLITQKGTVTIKGKKLVAESYHNLLLNGG